MKHKLKQRLHQAWKTAKLTANLMVGVPDYANYVARQRRYNPNAPVVNAAAEPTAAAAADSGFSQTKPLEKACPFKRFSICSD